MCQHGSVLAREMCQVVSIAILWRAHEGGKEAAQIALRDRRIMICPSAVSTVRAVVALNGKEFVHVTVASMPVVQGERSFGQPLFHSVEQMLADSCGR